MTIYTVLSETVSQYHYDHDMTGDLLLSSGFFSFSSADPFILAASLREPLVRSSFCKVLFLADDGMHCSLAHTGDTSEKGYVGVGGWEEGGKRGRGRGRRSGERERKEKRENG